MNPAEFLNIARAERDLWWYRGMNAILFQLLDAYLPPVKVRRVLDAGCGTGYLASVLSRRGLPMYAIDLGHQGVELARTQGVERVSQANVLALPFPSGAFDAVLSMDVFVHLERGVEVDALVEMGRVLAPGGLLFLRAAAFDFLRSRHSMFVDEKQRFTRVGLIAAARRAGLTVVRSTYANTFLLPVALAKFRLWEPLTNQPPASGVDPVPPALNALLYAPLAAEARLIGSGINLPIGQSVIVVARKA